MWTKEQKGKQSQKMMGHKVSQETRDKISRTKTGNTHLSTEAIGKMLISRRKAIDEGRWHGSKKGQYVSDELRQRRRDDTKKMWQNPEIRERMCASLKGRVPSFPKGAKLSLEMIENQRQGQIRAWRNPETRKKHLASYTPERREKISCSLKLNWQDKEKRDQRVKAVLSSLHIRPNKPEKIVLGILDSLFPKEWRYTGDGSVIIDGLNPDFMNVNGKKQIIEVFGDYFHSIEKVRTWRETEPGRIEVFRAFGYETLIIWERELKDPDKVLVKITEFVNGVNKCQ